ncbi:MAG: arylesterase [Gammaproteobacteria bacterium]
MVFHKVDGTIGLACTAGVGIRRCARVGWLLVLLLWAFGVSAAGSEATEPPVLMVLGDSLSSAFGIEVEEGWVQLLQRRLDQQGRRYRVVNASISGDTSGAGLARLGRALAMHRPAIVLVELGGNDGLRGLDLKDMRRNLEQIVSRSQRSGAQVLLLGMRIPPNYGPAYSEGFHDVYVQAATQYRISLVPFLLAGIADDPQLMQADGIHPKASAQAQILENVWPYLEAILS